MDKIVEAMAREMRSTDAPNSFAWDDLVDETKDWYRSEARRLLAVAGPMVLEMAIERIMPRNDPADWTHFATIRADAANDIRNLKEQFNGNG